MLGNSATERGRADAQVRRRAATLASCIALAALVVATLFGDRGMLHLIAQKQRAESLAREIEELRAENQRLASEIVALKSDPDAIEHLAREQLGLARPGETVFLIREAEASQTPRTAE
ncbi:MAG TPA: septum formation initiator family protein [Vicinamibacteria bacterium]